MYIGYDISLFLFLRFSRSLYHSLSLSVSLSFSLCLFLPFFSIITLFRYSFYVCVSTRRWVVHQRQSRLQLTTLSVQPWTGSPWGIQQEHSTGWVKLGQLSPIERTSSRLAHSSCSLARKGSLRLCVLRLSFQALQIEVIERVSIEREGGKRERAKRRTVRNELRDNFFR